MGPPGEIYPDPSENDPFLDDRTALHPGHAVAAILLTPDDRYVLQLRDRKPGIFFPGRWSCFGGGVEAGDAAPEAALARELHEELGLDLAGAAVAYFTNSTFDMSFCGVGVVYRRYYEVRLKNQHLNVLRIREGQAFDSFTFRDLMSRPDIVPYDAFVLWLLGSRARLTPG